jgi:hypothetical protein
LTPFLLLGCGGTSVRHIEDDTASGGSSGSAASGGSAGNPAKKSLCVPLEQALERAQACSTDTDCGKFVDEWPCSPPDAVPPLVNVDSDLGEIRSAFSQALEGDCEIVVGACTTCYVEQPECIDAKCSWHYVNCGPPPN